MKTAPLDCNHCKLVNRLFLNTVFRFQPRRCPSIPPQLKVLQEIITMIVFAGFSVAYMKVPVTQLLF